MVEVVFGVLGAALVAFRRPLAQLILEWRNLFPPRLKRDGTRTGEVFLALVGVFFLASALIVLVFG